MNIKLVARYIGIALLFNAVFMLISAGVSAYYDFDSAFSSLLFSGFICGAVGVFPLIFVRKSENINLRDGFAIIILAWVLSCFFGALPYLMWGGPFTPINAWFESVSGYTTTGATILQEVEIVPKGLLFWRSSTHFIGGIGVVIFMLIVLPSQSTFIMKISRMEISTLSMDNFKYKTQHTVRIIGSVYLAITVLSTISLMIAGMNFYDAINHAFSIVSTGGFSTKNSSILSFHSFPIEMVSMIFMLFAGLHFGLLYSFFAKGSKELLRSPAIRFFLLTVLVFSLAIALNIKLSGNVNSWGMALREGFFHTISYGTTTGLAITDTTLWPNFSIWLLIYLSVQTACSGSTTGGIKVDRMFIFFQIIRTQIKRHFHPNAVVTIRYGNHTISRDNAYNVVAFIAFYILILFIGTLLLSLTDVSLEESFSASVASLGNVGPALGRCNSLGNYNSFSQFAKIVLMIEMLIGRLEIYTMLMVFVIFRKNNKSKVSFQ